MYCVAIENIRPVPQAVTLLLSRIKVLNIQKAMAPHTIAPENWIQ